MSSVDYHVFDLTGKIALSVKLPSGSPPEGDSDQDDSHDGIIRSNCT